VALTHVTHPATHAVHVPIPEIKNPKVQAVHWVFKVEETIVLAQEAQFLVVEGEDAHVV
jgi:hypothetical protein